MLPCRVETRGGDSTVGSGVRGAGWKGVSHNGAAVTWTAWGGWISGRCLHDGAAVAYGAASVGLGSFD